MNGTLPFKEDNAQVSACNFTLLQKLHNVKYDNTSEKDV